VPTFDVSAGGLGKKQPNYLIPQQLPPHRTP